MSVQAHARARELSLLFQKPSRRAPRCVNQPRRVRDGTQKRARLVVEKGKEKKRKKGEKKKNALPHFGKHLTPPYARTHNNTYNHLSSMSASGGGGSGAPAASLDAIRARQAKWMRERRAEMDREVRELALFTHVIFAKSKHIPFMTQPVWSV